MNNQSELTIIEFDQQYTNQVIQLIGDSLKDLEIIPQSVPSPDDPDLTSIPTIYKGRSGFWLALNNNKLVGTVAIRELDAKTAKLNRMFVLKQFHGKGVGQQLFEHALTFARSHGFTELTLRSHVNMKRAHAFYTKNGFVKTKEHPDKYSFARVL